MGHGFNSYVTNYQRVNHGLNHGKSHESLSEATASLYLTDPDDSSVKIHGKSLSYMEVLNANHING